MKKNIKRGHNKAAALLSLVSCASLMLASCAPDIDGTTANYEEKKQEQNADHGFNALWWTSLGYGYSSNIRLGTTSLDSAQKNSDVSLSVYTMTKLDKESLDSAVTFYSLKTNTDNELFYPMHDAVLEKSLVTVSERSSDPENDPIGSEGVATSISYEINAESVTTDKIAVVVDATKLRDVSGNLPLNLNNNKVFGEAADSFVSYISVYEKNDGTATDSLGSYYQEEFNHVYTPVQVLRSLSITQNSSDGSCYDILIPATGVPNESGSVVYDETLSDTLKRCAKIRVALPESAVAEDQSLEWIYDSSTHVYKATTGSLPYGTKIPGLVFEIPEISVPQNLEKVYGHPAVALTEILSVGSKYLQEPYSSTTLNFIKDEPEFIVSDYSDPADSAWTSGTFYEYDIQLAQDSLLSVSYSTKAAEERTYGGGLHSVGNYYTFEVSTMLGATLSTYEDFILTDSYNRKIESVKSFVKNADGSLRTVYIATKMPCSSQPKLWVGSGTTLSQNAAHPRQLKFGTFKNVSKGDVSGYVNLY